jgi:hypothetical protein
MLRAPILTLVALTRLTDAALTYDCTAFGCTCQVRLARTYTSSRLSPPRFLKTLDSQPGHKHSPVPVVAPTLQVPALCVPERSDNADQVLAPGVDGAANSTKKYVLGVVDFPIEVDALSHELLQVSSLN